MSQLRIRHRWLAVLLVSLCTFLLAACSDDRPAEEVAASTPREAGPVVVRFSFWGDDWEIQLNQRLIRTFEMDNPGIRVEPVHQPWNDYFTWLRGELNAGRAPDVMFIDPVPYYAAQGVLEPLEPYIQRDQVNTNDFYPALLNRFRYQDQLYGLPRDNDTKVIFYNRDHFAAAGLPEPDEGWTWNDLYHAAVALTQRDGAQSRYGFGFEPNWWQVWLWARGCETATAPPLVRVDEQPCIDGLTALQDLIFRDRVTPPVDKLNSDAMGELFRQGRLSMMFGNHALVPSFTEAGNVSWDIAPLPKAPLQANVAGGAGYAVAKTSTQKEAAWRLVRFLTDRKAQAILAESGVITPARRSVRENNIFLRQRPYRSEVFNKETERGIAPVDFPEGSGLGAVVDAALAKVWNNERPAAEVLRELAATARAQQGR